MEDVGSWRGEIDVVSGGCVCGPWDDPVGGTEQAGDGGHWG